MLATTIGTSSIILTMAAAASDNSSIRRLSRGNNALLRKPFRKLDAAQQFDGSSSIKFSKCVDIKTLPDNYHVDDDAVASTIKSGDLVSTKSYVLFHMCNGGTCYEDEEYIVDINTYTNNIASYYANYDGAICQACNKYADFCSSGNDDGGNSYNNNNNYNNYYNGEYLWMMIDFYSPWSEYRNLLNSVLSLFFFSGGNRQLKNFDCDECDQYSCFSNNNKYNAYNDAINNLIDDISDCLRTGSYASNGEELYVGPMCSANGKGVELALFLDNECTTYTAEKAFGSLPSYYMYSSEYVFEATKDSFQKAYSETTSCEDLDVANPYNQANDDGANYDGNQEMNAYCQQLFDEGGALGLSSCSANDDQNGNYNYGNDDQNNGNNGGDDFLSWYTYDMTVDNAQDIDQVCSAVSEMGGSYSNYYNKYKSGTWNSASSSGGGSYLDMGDVEESAVVAVGFLSFFLIGAVAGGAWLYKKQKEKELDSKLERLNSGTFESIRTDKGTMESIRTEEGVMT